MKRVLFIHTQTLYSKVTIPLALYFARSGYGVSYAVNRPTFLGRSFGFSDRYIRNKPTSVAVINPEALQFAARLIGYEEQWQAHSGQIDYVWRKKFKQFDAVIGTTKNLDWLREIKSRYGIPTFAIGYQHIPFVAQIDHQFDSYEGTSEKESIFLTDNAFANAHNFRQILRSCGLRLCTFTFLDKVYQNYQAQKPLREEEARFVLIFHPGGYRRVLTEASDSKAACYAKQKRFLEQLCLPLVQAGLKPVVKIHPLRAKFHDLNDVKTILRGIERENNLDEQSMLCIGPESWYWQYAFRSSFILTFGSSSIYELWSAGLSNVFVCDFVGRARSQKFRFFDSIFIPSYDAYLEFVTNEGVRDQQFDGLTSQVFEGYRGLFNGQAAQTAYQLISQQL